VALVSILGLTLTILCRTFCVFESRFVKALVTGANGFLGSYLVRQLLKQNYEVTAMTRRRDEGLASLNVEMAHGDVRDFDSVLSACTGQDIVFHTAGISGIWGPWKRFYTTNTGTLPQTVVVPLSSFQSSRGTERLKLE